MSKSLIRKNQLHPDITDLVGRYGSGYFISLSSSGDLINSLEDVISQYFESTVKITGNQTINGEKTFRNLKIGPSPFILDQTVDINYYNNNWRLVSNNTDNSEIVDSALVRGSGLPGYGDSFWAWRFNTYNYDVLQLNNADAYADEVGNYPNSFKYFDISVLGTGYNEYFYLDSQSGVMRLTKRPTVNGTGVLLQGEDTNITTGKTIYVDANAGTDTRGTLSKYSAGSPFATIAAAVAASVTGDLVWIRKGSYAITSTISLDGKGDIQCEAGTTISVGGNITAFSTSETKTVIGDVFVLTDTAKLVVISGGTLRFEFASISSTSTGTLFTVTAGTIDTSFAYIVASSARAFELTGSGSMRIRRSHSVSCQQFLYANTTGGATIDLWTVVGNSPDTVFYIDNIAGLSYRGVNCNSSVGQNSYTGGYQGSIVWDSNLLIFPTSNSIQLNSTGAGGLGYAINTTQAQITSPSRYSFSSKLKWNASRLAESSWYGPAALALSNSNNLEGNYLCIGLTPVLDDTWARPFIDFKLGANTGSAIVYTESTWNGVKTTLDNNGAIRLQNQPTPAVITVVKTSKESLRVVINSPLDGDRIITIKFTTQEAIDAFASFNRFGYAAFVSDWTFSDQVIEGNLAPTFFFNYPQSTAEGGPISEVNPVLRNIRVNVANPITPATIFTTNAQRYFYLDNVKIASWDNRLSIDSLAANTPVVAYDVYSNRPVSSNVSVTGVYTQIATIF